VTYIAHTENHNKSEDKPDFVTNYAAEHVVNNNNNNNNNNNKNKKKKKKKKKKKL